MAFAGRGNMPNIGNNTGGGIRIHIHRMFHHYIPLDNTYVIMQMIVTFIILIVGIITFLTTYESTITDPIESTKRLFINSHLITIVFFLAITFVINLYSKKESDLIKRLLLIFIVSIIIMLVFLGIKLNLDKTYTKAKFEQFYAEQNIDEETSQKHRIDIGLTGMSIKTEKEYYIDECMKLYNIFKTKSYASLALHMLLNILLIFQVVKVEKIKNKKERLDKDDVILFDEVQNVKY